VLFFRDLSNKAAKCTDESTDESTDEFSLTNSSRRILDTSAYSSLLQPTPAFSANLPPEMGMAKL
jgi:hypothetical protein